MQRPDDYEKRRQHLAGLSDEELYERFWSLANEVIRPLVDMAQKYTSPSIERSVLLRMGFSSLEAKEIVDKCLDRGLLGKGVGHCVWWLAKEKGIPVREAGLALAEGKHWDQVDAHFGGGNR
ncbi:MAG: ornithine aminomutase subunit alpha [Bacillota bacterium]